MKKLLTTLTAAVMLGTLLTAPVSAEETYKMGDVNMDGFIGADDAQLVLMDYLNYYIMLIPNSRRLTEEQVKLGNIDQRTDAEDFQSWDGTIRYHETEISGTDAQLILSCYLETALVNPDAEQPDALTWARENRPHIYADLSEN